MLRQFALLLYTSMVSGYSNAPLIPGNQYAFSSKDRKQFCNGDGGIYCKCSSFSKAGNCGKFTIFDKGDGKVALKCCNGKFMRSDYDKWTCNGSDSNDRNYKYAQFKVQQVGSYVAFFVPAENFGQGTYCGNMGNNVGRCGTALMHDNQYFLVVPLATDSSETFDSNGSVPYNLKGSATTCSNGKHVSDGVYKAPDCAKKVFNEFNSGTCSLSFVWDPIRLTCYCVPHGGTCSGSPDNTAFWYAIDFLLCSKITVDGWTFTDGSTTEYVDNVPTTYTYPQTHNYTNNKQPTAYWKQTFSKTATVSDSISYNFDKSWSNVFGSRVSQSSSTSIDSTTGFKTKVVSLDNDFKSEYTTTKENWSEATTGGSSGTGLSHEESSEATITLEQDYSCPGYSICTYYMTYVSYKSHADVTATATCRDSDGNAIETKKVTGKIKGLTSTQWNVYSVASPVNSSGPCDFVNGDLGCCTEDEPCGSGQGGCQTDSDCQAWCTNNGATDPVDPCPNLDKSSCEGMGVCDWTTVDAQTGVCRYDCASITSRHDCDGNPVCELGLTCHMSVGTRCPDSGVQADMNVCYPPDYDCSPYPPAPPTQAVKEQRAATASATESCDWEEENCDA